MAVKRIIEWLNRAADFFVRICTPNRAHPVLTDKEEAEQEDKGRIW